VKQLVKGQCRNGQWTYAYRATAHKKSGDNSNTQLAALALAAARRRGFPVPVEAFARLRGYLETSRNADGGFGYARKQRSSSYGSMTAGCAMALALSMQVVSPDADPAAYPPVRRALAWLGRDFDPRVNPGVRRAFGRKRGNRRDSYWRHYWPWSIERACSASAATSLGEADWYAQGARFLLETQQPDGSWRDPENKLRATCFALLFLTRSTRRVLTPRSGEITTTPAAR